MLTGQGENRLGQAILALGGQGGGVLAVVAQGDGVADVVVSHALSSIQRCSIRVTDGCGGTPSRQLSSPTVRPAACSLSRKCSSSCAMRVAVCACVAHSCPDSRPWLSCA